MVATPRSMDGSARQRRTLVERALVAAKAGRWDDARAANTELLELDPNSAETQNRLGKALSELGRYREAHAAYTRARDLEPHNLIAQRNLERLNSLRDLPDEPAEGNGPVRAYAFIEETGKTMIVALVRPAEVAARSRVLAGDPLEVRIDTVAECVTIHTPTGVYIGEVEPRIAERIVRLSRDGNRYTAAAVELEQDTLRVILRETYQDPSLTDQLSFPTRVRGATPRAYIRRDFVTDQLLEEDVLADGDEEEAEPEEAEDEPEIEDEEFSDDDSEMSM
jgi:tetratricopeptide (TPR) repeat protein